MNNIKKFLGLVLVAVFAFVLVGCGPSAEQVKLEEQADKIYLGDLSEVSKDLMLPKFAFGDKEFTVTWASDNEAIIDVRDFEDDNKELYFLGYVELPANETVVKLTATVTYKGETTTRVFEVTVVADEFKNYDTIAAAKAKDDKEKDVSKVKFTGTVTYTTSSGFVVSDSSASMYCYGSNHGRTIGEKVVVRGVWTYYNNMVQIATGANVKVLGTDTEVTLASIAQEATIADICAIEAKSVDPENSTRAFKVKFVAQENAAGSYNTYKLVDPTDATKFVDVSKYNDATSLTKVGELAATGKFYEGIVIIYCSRSAGNGGLWDVLLVAETVAETTITLTDEQKVNAVVAGLTSSFSGIKVKENLELPTTHANGSTIAWASNNEAVISAAGAYVAPKADTEVTLTATVTAGEVVKTVELVVVAKGATKTVANLVTSVEAGVAYKLGLEQASLEKTLFATGLMNGYYGATTEDHTEGVDVFLEAVDGGYNLYCMVEGAKKYINVVVSGTYKNYKYEDAASTVWTFSEEHNTILCTIEGAQYFIGTRGTYNTIGAYAIAEIAADFPVHFYKEEADVAYAKGIEVEKAYKLGLEQANLDKVLFATGLMNGYYGATTEAYAEGVDVFFEAVDGGYNLYCTVEGAKKYINVVVSGTYKNYKYEDAASTVWTFDAANNTILCTIEGAQYFIGTRGTYNTIGAYSVDEIAEDFPVKLFVKDPNAGAAEEEKPVEEVTYVSAVEAGVAYKLGLEQTGLGKTLFATGLMSGYYGATTEAIAEGVDVFLEAVDGGYNLYCMVEGAKKYINVVVSGTYKNYKYEDAASTVWTFSEEHKTILCTIEGAQYFIGTRGTYNTIGAYSVDEIAEDFPVHFYKYEGAAEEDKEEEKDPADATATFSDKANRTEFSTEKQVWVSGGITVTNNKSGATSNVADYADPARFYKGSELVIACEESFKVIVITTSDGKCYDAAATIEGATLVVEDGVMTITLTEAATSFTIAELATQIRVSKIELYFAE